MALAADDLHLWRVSLDIPVATAGRLPQVLSSDEKSRAAAFHFDIDRNRFVVARGCLRIILGLYLKTDPAEIRFIYAAHGKPSIVSPLTPALDFNVAHSGGLLLCAITNGCEVGVDLEAIRADFPADQIAARFFSASEVARLRSLPVSEQITGFFNCWTRKEAFLKAKGTGLSLTLDQFDVTLAPDEPAVLLRTEWDSHEATRWVFKSIDLGADFAAALAFEGHDRTLHYWDLEESRIAYLLAR